MVGACQEPDRAAGKSRTAGVASAPPYEGRIVSYIGKVERKFKRIGCAELEKCGTGLMDPNGQLLQRLYKPLEVLRLHYEKKSHCLSRRRVCDFFE